MRHVKCNVTNWVQVGGPDRRSLCFIDFDTVGEDFCKLVHIEWTIMIKVMKKKMPLKMVFGLHGQVVFRSGRDSPASRLAPSVWKLDTWTDQTPGKPKAPRRNKQPVHVDESGVECLFVKYKTLDEIPSTHPLPKKQMG